MESNLRELKVYECRRKELPENLKTKNALEKLGLIPNENPVAVFKNGTNVYNLYDINTAVKITVKDIRLGDKEVLINSMKEVPSNLKTIKGLNSIGLNPVEGVYATIKIGERIYDLYEVDKTEIVDEEKYDIFKNKSKKPSYEKLINPNDFIVRYEDKMPIYKCSWSKLPSNLKAKRGFHKLDLQPTGNVVAKLDIGGRLYDLYDLSESKHLDESENPYRRKEKNKVKKSKSNKSEIRKNKKEPYKIQHFNTFTLFEDEMIKFKDDYVILDTETTGIENDDEIIQLSLVNLDGEVLYSSYFKPQKKSHWGALKKHKLTDKFLSDKPLFKDEWIKIADILKNKNILIHNAIFDQRLVEQTCSRYSINIDFKIDSFCTMKYCKEKYGYAKLETVLEKNNISFNSNTLHNSLVDCFMTLKVIYPESIVFKMQEEAQKLFNLACDKKINAGDKDGRNKGINWLYKTYGIKNGEVAPYISLRLCNAIISQFKYSI